jgi:hypothetical protein
MRFAVAGPIPLIIPDERYFSIALFRRGELFFVVFDLELPPERRVRHVLAHRLDRLALGEKGIIPTSGTTSSSRRQKLAIRYSRLRR